MTAWERIRDTDFAVPDTDPSTLADELLAMLASPDPRIRDDTALPILGTWIEHGVFDGMLADLGDRLCAMFHGGQVFGRSFAALALGACVDRDTSVAHVVDSERIHAWAREVTTWLRTETDARGFVDGSGWAHAFAHGADAVGSLARSPRLDADDLAWLLRETAAIVRRPSDPAWWQGEPDRWALAIRAILGRDLVPPDAWREWIAAVSMPSRRVNPYLDTANADAVLRALHLHLKLGGDADRFGLGAPIDAALLRSLAPYLDRG